MDMKKIQELPTPEDLKKDKAEGEAQANLENEKESILEDLYLYGM